MTPKCAATITLVIILVLLFKFPVFFVCGLFGLIILVFVLTLWEFLYRVFEQWL